MRHLINLIEAKVEIQFDNVALKELYDSFNQLYFDGELPDIKVEYASLKGVGGIVTFNIKHCHKLVDGRLIQRELIPDSVKLKISSMYKKELKDIEGILLHEMIHVYFITVRHMYKEVHGVYFLAKRREISKKSGIDVPLTEKIEGFELTKKPTKKIGLIVLRKANTVRIALVSEAFIRENLEALKDRQQYFLKNKSIDSAEFLVTYGTIEKTFPIQRRKIADLGYYRMNDKTQAMFKEALDNGEVLAKIGGATEN